MSATAPQAPGLTRTDIQEHDLSIPGRQVIQNRVDISPDAPVFRHKHPGEEVIYVLEGSLQYDIDGQTPIRVSAGEGLLVVKNRGDCPLGGLQERLGDPIPLFELVLPPRAAKLAVPVLGAIAGAGIALLARDARTPPRLPRSAIPIP